MPVKIGANPIIWSNDDMPEIGGATPLDTCLSEARQAGLQGMELGNKFPREPAALKAALAPYSLACVSGWYSSALLERSAEDEARAIDNHVALLSAMGSKVVIVAETSNAIHSRIDVPLSRRPELDAAQWRLFADRLTTLGHVIADRGMALVYHHHMGTVVQSRDDIGRLMDLTGPSVHLLLDSGHALWGGSDPVELATTYRERVRHVHTKDMRPDIRAIADTQDWSFLNAVLGGVFTVPGDGCIDYRPFFRALRGYDGWVVIEAEQDPEKADPLTYVTKGRRYLTQVLTEQEML
ncbi:sugar phosphate isomerase/epimerase [Ameyamaea chiangmaiensis NBRC 103196]|uniref:Myo-inosose-2 dehydratase n=1 Tax=Ameyamaea chiangmaiensis TaxID=442969 RepID=A0A850PAV6_9PROT|nr:myo-inosose-2 dehydratase [Ameyamaea chiangmaiensis]MBS4075031.1 myo-inosose-2 dehydratase [Ameyamaea chiangmaiensis]NVN40073.1 myo-inosose-2 dehydratase [Ameyamaea chiangmaiensis]GBQ65710.1 sugar phosphate isomerase/epimerase [Ameyamaea chiangmaiensis NBRC 103196]